MLRSERKPDDTPDRRPEVHRREDKRALTSSSLAFLQLRPEPFAKNNELRLVFLDPQQQRLRPGSSKLPTLPGWACGHLLANHDTGPYGPVGAETR